MHLWQWRYTDQLGKRRIFPCGLSEEAAKRHFWSRTISCYDGDMTISAIVSRYTRTLARRVWPPENRYVRFQGHALPPRGCWVRDRGLACWRSGAVPDESRSDCSTRHTPSAGMTASMSTTAFTAFVEEGVPPVTVNPENYVMECVGPLHIIRYEKGHLFSIFESCGFEVERFDHGKELDGQSGIYLRPRQ